MTNKKKLIHNYTILNGYNKGYKEIIRINKYNTSEYVNIRKEAKEEDLTFELYFGQINSFKKEKDLIPFIFIGLTSQILSENPIIIKVNITDGIELLNI